ncbi:hypothetical protein DVH24_007938 [Malus domestica]|uniref:Uncharacterized protein n=1 Tax=Malus domestica TaxID=3750 RepID=A0A498JI81_MALDO|nr:hypothetical protein DVH24_007938 [Malus domestica]
MSPIHVTGLVEWFVVWKVTKVHWAYMELEFLGTPKGQAHDIGFTLHGTPSSSSAIPKGKHATATMERGMEDLEREKTKGFPSWSLE